MDALLRKVTFLSTLFIVLSAVFLFGARHQDFLSLIQLALIVPLVLWAIRIFTNKDQSLNFGPAHWCFLAFLALVIFGYSKAPVELVASFELYRFVSYFAVFLIASNLDLKRKDFRFIIYALAVILAIEIMLGVPQGLKHEASILWLERSPRYALRAMGSFTNPNHFAFFTSVSSLTLISFAACSRMSPLTKAIFFYLACAGIAVVLLTRSRGGILALAAGIIPILLFTLQHHRYKRAIYVLTGLAGIALVLLLSNSHSLSARWRSLASDSKEVDPRVYVWYAANQMYLKSPVTGVGPGHFDVHYNQYRETKIQTNPEFTHNDYLQILTDYGTIGFLIAAVGCGFLIRRIRTRFTELLRKHPGAADKSDRVALTLSAAAALAAYLTHAFTEFNLMIPANVFLLILLFAPLWSSSRKKVVSHPARFIGGSLALVMAFAMALHAWPRWNYARTMGEFHSSESTAAAVKHLERALTFEPQSADALYRLGETYRRFEFANLTHDDSLMIVASTHLAKAIQSNPYEPRYHAKLGMCLDWQGRHKESEFHFQRALELGKHNYQIESYVGWHYIQTGNYTLAFNHLRTSIGLEFYGNPFARDWYDFVKETLEEKRARH